MTALNDTNNHQESAAQNDHATPSAGGAAASAERNSNSESQNNSIRWERINWPERVAVLASLLVLAVVTIPRLPPGVCHDDSGGIQLAAATLGITHPPGYVGYVSIGHVLTLVPGVNPAYMVTLGCWGAGMVVVFLAIMLQIRLGVNAFIAASLGLGFAYHHRIWSNLLMPEVYMPTLAFVAASAYLLVKYATLGKRRCLLWSALLFGVALSNRPPTLFVLPFLVAGWWCAENAWSSNFRSKLRTFVIVVIVAALPGVYAVGYLWVKDRPETTYNYLEAYNVEWQSLPSSNAGVGAKIDRITWLVSGAQFRTMMGTSWKRAKQKFRWLRGEILPDGLARILLYRAVTDIAVGLLVLLGAICVFKRSMTAGWLLIGMLIGSVAFVTFYRIHGDAADIRPLLFAVTVLIGAAVSNVFSRYGNGRLRYAAPGLFIIACVFTLADAPYRRTAGLHVDASEFAKNADLASLPQDAIVLSAWPNVTPLWFYQKVLTPRPDINIICAVGSNWRKLVEHDLDRPIYAATLSPPDWPGYTWKPLRNISRLERNEEEPPTRTRQD